MNQEILNLIARADFSSAVSEVEKFKNKLTGIQNKFREKFGMSPLQWASTDEINKLYSDMDRLIQKKKEFSKAERRGTFKEQIKSANRLKTAVNDVAEDFSKFSKTAAGRETALKPMIHDLNVLQKEITELSSKKLSSSIVGRSRADVEKLQNELKQLPHDSKKWEKSVMAVYKNYKNIKRDQDKIIATMKNYEAQERKIKGQSEMREQNLRDIVSINNKNASVIANQIVPNTMKEHVSVKKIAKEYKGINSVYDRRIAKAKKYLNQLIKEGASSKRIELYTKQVLKWQKRKRDRAAQVSNQMRAQVRYLEKMNKRSPFGRFVTSLSKMLTGLKRMRKGADQASKSLTRLDIQGNKNSDTAIRMGGHTKGLLRTFSRWRNRILVTTFAVAGLVRGMRRMIDMAVEAQKQFIALSKVSENLGISENRVTQAAKQLAEDGLVSLKEATQSMKALIATGADVSTVVNNLNKMKDAAIANGRAGYTVGQNLVAYARGVKQMRSQLADAAGVMKNISQILQEHPDWVQTYGTATALLKGYTKEAERFGGSVEEMLKTLPGQVQKLKGQMSLFKTEVGAALAAFSEQWTKHLLGRIQEARKQFGEQEGAVYKWFNILGRKVVDVMESIEEFVPAALEIVKSLMNVSTVIIDVANGFSKIIGGIDKLGGKFLSFMIQLRVIKALLFSAVTGVQRMANAFMALNPQVLSAGFAGLASSLNSVGLALSYAMPYIQLVAGGLSLLAPLVISYFKKSKERAAELSRELDNNRKAWDKLRKSIGSVGVEMDRIIEKRGEEYTRENLETELKSYLNISNIVSKLNDKTDKLVKKREILMDLASDSYTSIDNQVYFLEQYNKVDKKIAEIEESKTYYLEKQSSFMKDIQKLGDRFKKDFNLKTVFIENGQAMVSFTKKIKQGNKLLEKTFKWTWDQFMTWIKINEELNKSMSGVKQLQEDTNKASRQARSDIRDIKQEIDELNYSDVFSDIMGNFNKYVDTILSAQKNLDNLNQRLDDTNTKLKTGATEFENYMSQVYEMSQQDEGFSDMFRFDVWLEEGNIKETFTGQIRELLSAVRSGRTEIENEIGYLSAFAEKHRISFYNEGQLRTFLNLVKQRKALIEDVESARANFDEKTQVALKRIIKQYKILENTRTKEAKKQNEKLKDQINLRSQNIDILNRQISILKERGKLISAGPLESLEVKETLQAQEDVIDKMNLEQQQIKEKMKLQADYRKLLSQSVEDHSAVEAAIEKIKNRYKESNKLPEEQQKIVNNLKSVLESIETSQSNWNTEKEEALKNLTEEHDKELKLLEIRKQQERHEKALQDARKMSQLSFWKKEFQYQEQKRRANAQGLDFWDKLSSNAEQYVKTLSGMDSFGGGSFIGAGLKRMGWGGMVDIDEMEKKLSGLAFKLSEMSKFGLADTDEYKEIQEAYQNTLSATDDFWNEMESIYTAGTQQVLNLMTNYIRKQQSLRQERVTEESEYVGKLKAYREANLLSYDQYKQKREDYDKYMEDRAKLHRIQMRQYKKQMVGDTLISVGTQVAAIAMGKILSKAINPVLALGIGTGMIALGGMLSVSDRNYGKKMASWSGRISGRKETGYYGTAFESVTGGTSGGTSGTGTTSAGSTVSAPPQNININPNIEFNGEIMFLTPHGEADMTEVGDQLGTTIVGVVKDAIETNDINFTG